MRSLVIFFSLLVALPSFAQKEDSLRLITFNGKDKVQLKWLPGNYNIWLKGMKNGYHLDRYEVQLVSGSWKSVSKERLTKDPIKPWDIERLKREAPNNPDLQNIDLMILGQDLNDKSKANNKKDFAEVQSNKDMAFIMALFAQVLKNKTAEAMGTFYEDKTAQAGKTYLYRITINEPKGLTADAVVNRNVLTGFPKISGFDYVTVHKGVDLYWLNNPQSGYIYYNIVRSDAKNGNFVKLNDLPFIGEVGIQLDKKRIKYTDSLPEAGKTFYYKVVGVDAFENEGPPSNVLTVQSKYFLQKAPFITIGESPDNKEVELGWEVDNEEKSYIRGFSVWHSTSPSGTYTKIHTGELSFLTLRYKDTRKNKTSSNYYTVCAYGQYGDSACSVLKSVFLIDSIPPASPIVLSGVCDTNGVVTLTWKRGPEADILGYRVFKTYYSHKEPERITVEYVADTLIKDTVEIKSGYKKVYYGVSAIDQHFNPSPLSKYFEVPIPDKNPPVNAIFKDYQAGYTGISLVWIPSPSEDIKTQYLLRKSEFDFAWQPVLKLKGDSLSITQMRDTLTKSGIWYEYALQAEDSSGLKSKLSESLRILQPEKNPFPIVKNLRAVVSKENKMVKLSWEFETNAVGFKIMRGAKGGPVETYEFVPGAKREFYDKWLTPNTEYEYAIIAEVAGNRKSLMSNKVIVKY